MEPGLEETHKIDRRRMSQVSRKSSKPNKIIKEEFLEPVSFSLVKNNRKCYYKRQFFANQTVRF